MSLQRKAKASINQTLLLPASAPGCHQQTVRTIREKVSSPTVSLKTPITEDPLSILVHASVPTKNPDCALPSSVSQPAFADGNCTTRRSRELLQVQAVDSRSYILVFCYLPR